MNKSDNLMSKIYEVIKLNKVNLNYQIIKLLSYQVIKLFKNKGIKSDMPHQQKSIEQYRRDIFAMKSKLKDEQQYLKELQQKYADIDVFQEKSYSFPLKMKILEYDLNTIKQKMLNFSEDDAFDLYALNYSTLALMKSCEIMGINKEMIFRAVDLQNKNIVDWFDLANFLKQTMRLSAQIVNPIMKVLDPKSTGKVDKNRYMYYLQCFMINSQQGKQEINTLQEACQRIAKQAVIQKIDINKLWRGKQLNIATLAHGFMKNLINIDVLDTFAFYIKLDPVKKGYVQTRDAMQYLQKKMFDTKNFQKTNLKLKK